MTLFCDKITERSVEKFKAFDCVDYFSGFGFWQRLDFAYDFVCNCICHTLYNIVLFLQTSNFPTTFFQDIAKRNKIDTQSVRNFVLNNQFALEKAADELIRDSEFKQIMIKSGEIASTEERDELVHKTKMIIKNKLNNNKFSGKDKDNAEAALLEKPEIPCD